MIIKREEEWGILEYDTVKQQFSYIQNQKIDAIPYTQRPVLLNVDLTLKCNMNCIHCVAKDFEKVDKKIEDLVISDELIDWINKSDFMVVVITGGEPFLYDYEYKLKTLLEKIEGKGLIIDTNGTIEPREKLVKIIKKTNTLVRVSLDSIRPQDEICLRRFNLNKKENEKQYNEKIKRIIWFKAKGINIAIQSVVHKKNESTIFDIPIYLNEYSIKKWYLQRLIPSHNIVDIDTYNSDVRGQNTYNNIIERLELKCRKIGVECIAKRDRRHNSVFLLVGDGFLYTQSENPGKKILLGKINKDNIRFFDYVSNSDHAERYYDKKNNIT